MSEKVLFKYAKDYEIKLFNFSNEKSLKRAIQLDNLYGSCVTPQFDPLNEEWIALEETLRNEGILIMLNVDVRIIVPSTTRFTYEKTTEKTQGYRFIGTTLPEVIERAVNYLENLNYPIVYPSTK